MRARDARSTEARARGARALITLRAARRAASRRRAHTYAFVLWRDRLSRSFVLVARGRAQVSVAAAVTDWPKRIRDMRYVDHEDYGGTD